jgi:lipoprotein-anchoring transpeptidase ErfK/SrfK
MDRMAAKRKLEPLLFTMLALSVILTGCSKTITDDESDEHDTRTPRTLPKMPSDAPKDPAIVIDLSARTLTVLRGGKPSASYTIAVGKPSTPTPQGQFRITDMDPHLGPVDGVLGDRWLEFDRHPAPDGRTHLDGIHGTNHPEFLGQAVSHGCVRMSNHDVEEVFRQAYIGEPVIVKNGNTTASPSPASTRRSLTRKT